MPDFGSLKPNDDVTTTSNQGLQVFTGLVPDVSRQTLDPRPADLPGGHACPQFLWCAPNPFEHVFQVDFLRL
jgi:hypothetical protein